MDVRTGFFALLIVVLGSIAALIVMPLFQYVVAAALLAFLLYPLHTRLVPRVGSVASAIVLSVVAVVATVFPLLLISMVVLQTAIEFVQEFDQTTVANTVEERLNRYVDFEETFGIGVEEFVTELFEQYSSPVIESLLQEVTTLFEVTIRVAIGLMILVFLLYYFLKDGDDLLAWIREVAPLDDDVITSFFEETHVITWAMLKSHVFVAIVEGILGGIGLYLLGVPNALFWTVIMVIVSILPIIGVWLVWGPAVLYLFAVGAPVEAMLLFLYGVSVLAVVDNYLRAILVDRDSGLHPAVVLVGVIGGIYLLGIIGLFLGPILLAIFKASVTVFNEAYDLPDETVSQSE